MPDGWAKHQKTHDEQIASIAALPKETRCTYSWRFVVKMTNHGSGTEFSFPLVPIMLHWIKDTAIRVLSRMEGPKECPTDGYEWPFRNLSYGSVSNMDGKPVKDHYGFPPEFCSGSKEE